MGPSSLFLGPLPGRAAGTPRFSENLWSGPSTNLDRIGFKIALFPIKVEKASGAWIRAVAFVPEGGRPGA